MENIDIKCPKCGKNLEVQECGNARGYGWYAFCEECNYRKVLGEVDLTREIL